MGAALVAALVLLLAAMGSGCLKGVSPAVRGPGDGLSLRGDVLLRRGSPFTGVVDEMWPDGTLRTRSEYSRGRLHGEQVEYYPSGKLHWKRPFKRGVKDGTHIGWWENGRKMFEYHFRQGAYAGTTREWYESGGRAREGHYAKGVEAGLQRAWRENGAVYINYEARDGRQYGIINSRLCYSVKDGKGVYSASR